MNHNSNRQVNKIRVCWSHHGRITEQTIYNKIKQFTTNESDAFKSALSRAFERDEAFIEPNEDENTDFLILFDSELPLTHVLTGLNDEHIKTFGKELYFVCKNHMCYV